MQSKYGDMDLVFVRIDDNFRCNFCSTLDGGLSAVFLVSKYAQWFW